MRQFFIGARKWSKNDYSCEVLGIPEPVLMILQLLSTFVIYTDSSFLLQLIIDGT